MKSRAALAGERIGSGGERRRECAGGEGVESTEAAGEFGGGQAALAVEPPQKILRRLSPFCELHSIQQETRLR